MPEYPIYQILSTVEGEGPHTGRPVTVVRFGFSESLGYVHLLPAPSYRLPIRMLTEKEIVEYCQQATCGFVHLVGADPCLTEIEPLIALLAENYDVGLDTPGIVTLSQSTIESISFLSVSPKPGMPVSPRMLVCAHELRLYWSSVNSQVWEDNIDRALRMLSEENQKNLLLSILPKEMTEETIQGVLAIVRGEEGLPKEFSASIPLYRLFPNVDTQAHYIFNADSRSTE